MADNGLLNNPNLYDDDMADVKKPAASLFRELGIQTPGERQAAAMEQQQLMQALQQRQQQAQQQMAIQRAQMAGGYNFSALTAMGGNTPQTPPGGGFLGMKQPPQQGAPQMGRMQGGQGQDDAGNILTQALQQNPGNRGRALKQAGYKLLQVAVQRGDGNLQSIASNMLMKGQQFDQSDAKESAQTEDLQSQTQTRNQKAGLELAQAGNPGTPFQTTAENGDEVTKRDIKNQLGQVVGSKVEGRGPKKITQTNLDGGLNTAGISKNVDEFGKLVTNSDTTVVGMRRISQLLQQGAGQGWAAKGVGFVNNVKGLAQQIGSGASLSSGAEDKLSELKKQDFQKWATQTSIASSDWSDLVSSLAKTYNPTGTITEKDITRAAEAVGAGMTNVGSVQAVLKEAENRVYKNVDSNFRNAIPEVQKYTKGQYENFNGRFGHKAPVFVKTPDEARKVPKGTPFVNEQGEEFSNGS